MHLYAEETNVEDQISYDELGSLYITGCWGRVGGRAGERVGAKGGEGEGGRKKGRGRGRERERRGRGSGKSGEEGGGSGTREE